MTREQFRQELDALMWRAIRSNLPVADLLADLDLYVLVAVDQIANASAADDRHQHG